MQLHHIYIPIVRDSDRAPHKISVWPVWETELIRLYGGFSHIGSCEGAWTDDNGEVVRDCSVIYAVGHDGDPVDSGIGSKMVECIALAKKLFDQRTIFVVHAGECEIL